jgi:hypothetical protein
MASVLGEGVFNADGESRFPMPLVRVLNFYRGLMEVRRMPVVPLFTAHRQFYRMHRSMTRPFFAKDRIKDFEIFDKYAMKAIDKMKERFNEGYALNFEVGLYTQIFPKRLNRTNADLGCDLPFHPRRRL